MHKEEELKKGVRWSLLVHATLLILLASRFGMDPSAGDKKGGSEGEESDKQGLEQSIEVEIVDPPSQDHDTQISMIEADDIGKTPHASDECKEFYGGIGIHQMYTTYEDGTDRVVVFEVHPGYPAHRAGIEPGDALLNSGEIRGEIGTPVTVHTLKKGKPVTYSLIRDKICTSQITNKQGDSP